MAVSSSGEVFTWGADAQGCLGHGGGWFSGGGTEWRPRVLRTLSTHDVRAVSAGYAHSGAVTAGGEAFLWGDPDFVPGVSRARVAKVDTPRLVGWRRRGRREFEERCPGGRTQVESAHRGEMAACPWASASPAVDGSRNPLRMGPWRLLLRTGRLRVPFPPSLPLSHRPFHPDSQVPLRHAAGLACGGAITLGRDSAGQVYSWGPGQPGSGRSAPSGPSRPLPGIHAVDVASGWQHCAAFDHGGRLWTWGWGGSQGDRACDGWGIC